jgi:hypothetical protein
VVPDNNAAAEDRRRTVTVLLVGGMALVLLAQDNLGDVPPPRYWLNFLVLIAGVASFTAGGVLTGGTSRPFRRLARHLAPFRRRLRLPLWRLLLLFDAFCLSLLANLAAGDGSMARNLPVAVASWLLGIAFLLLGALPARPRLPRPGRREMLMVAGLFAGALLLRAVGLEQLPSNLSGDEGSVGLDAVRYLQGTADNPFRVGWFSFPSLYFWVQSLAIALLGQTTAALRVTSALAGALTVLGVYALGRVMFGRLTAALAAGFMAVFHFHVHFSRIGLNNIWDGLFAVTAVAGLWHGWRTGGRVPFLVAGLALGLGLYFYVTIRVLPLLLLAWIIVAALLDRDAFRKRRGDLLAMMAAALVVALPLLLYFQANPNEFQAPLQRVTILDGWLAAQPGSPLLIVLGQMRDTALGFTYLPLRLLYDAGAPLLLPISAALFTLGLLWALVHFDLRHLLLLLPLVAVVVLGGFSQSPPASQRYILAAPFVAILVALPLVAASGWLVQAWPRWRPLPLLAVAVLMALMAWSNLRFYFVTVAGDYVLGGNNTLAATRVALYLREQEPVPEVYFFGAPRMGYYSLATIPYLAPEIEAIDVIEPLDAPPAWPVVPPARFIFLPEREAELAFVRAAYPGGQWTWMADKSGMPLFLVYEWQPPAAG